MGVKRIVHLIEQYIGSGNDLSVLQMSIRAMIIFICALILIRVSGRRSFGMHSAFDNTIVILLGAILSRAVVGASPFIPVLSASLIIVLLHRLFAWLSVHTGLVGRLIKGRRITLYKDGKIINENMRKALVSKEDLIESAHIKALKEDLNDIDAAYMERCGQISVIKKEKD